MDHTNEYIYNTLTLQCGVCINLQRTHLFPLWVGKKTCCPHPQIPLDKQNSYTGVVTHKQSRGASLKFETCSESITLRFYTAKDRLATGIRPIDSHAGSHRVLPGSHLSLIFVITCRTLKTITRTAPELEDKH